MPNIILEKSNGIAKLTLARPPVNVINIALMRELNAALDEARDAKVVVIAAQGKFFSAGVDVSEHKPETVKMMLDEFHAVIKKIWKMEAPTVAAVQGSALGGGMELAMACDFIVASEAAKFGQPEIKVGTFPPIAALMLSQLVPRKKAFELILTGDAIDARAAERIGLVNAVASPETFETELNAFVSRLSKLSGVVLRHAKRAAMLPLRAEDDRVLAEIEKIYLEELMKTQDANEGLNAFMEKRQPNWKES
jgi:cyclohexa-1,5-dienecarbonyl-CoA hydratase